MASWFAWIASWFSGPAAGEAGGSSISSPLGGSSSNSSPQGGSSSNSSPQGGSSSNSSPPGGSKKPSMGEKVSGGVYKLSEPTQPLEVEIVFIHGLQTFDYKDAYWKTWTGGQNDSSGKEFCWPMTWLKEDFPGARIWSLCCDSAAWRTSTTGRVDSYILGETLVQEMVTFAKIGQHKCPVVFACHSFGGLVVKEIVIKAHTTFGRDEQYKNFLQSIKGYVFYATPHDGSHLADCFRYVPFSSIFIGPMVSQLEVINNGVGRLNSDFERIEDENYYGKWQYAVIAEANPITFPYIPKFINVKVVMEASAQHGYKNHITVAADHYGVCKPEDKTSTSYIILRNLIQNVVGDKPIPQIREEMRELSALSATQRIKQRT